MSQNSPAEGEGRANKFEPSEAGSAETVDRPPPEVESPGHPADVTMPRPASSDSVADFYNRNCYRILAIFFLANTAGAILFFSFYRQTAWLNLFMLIASTSGFVWTLFGIVADKNKIHKNKRIATYLLGCMVPAMQLLLGVGRDERNKKLSIIEDGADIATFQTAYATVQRNDSKPGASTAEEVNAVLPRLKALSKKYPLHPQLLCTLGLAQYEVKQYEEAKKTFQEFTNGFPNDFKGHYYLGISLKGYADEQEEAEIKAKNLQMWYCGTPAGAWMRKARWKPMGDEKSLREQAISELGKSLNYYYESSYTEEEKLGIKIARNIGWLYFQLSNGCQDEQDCKDAIIWHEKALGWIPVDNFPGDHKYVLALNNEGDIYRAIGDQDRDKSYASFCEAVKNHQEMLVQDSTQARSRNYSCLYKEFAHFLDEDNRKEDATKVEQMGKDIFGSPQDNTPSPSNAQINLEVCQNFSGHRR